MNVRLIRVSMNESENESSFRLKVSRKKILLVVKSEFNERNNFGLEIVCIEVTGHHCYDFDGFMNIESRLTILNKFMLISFEKAYKHVEKRGIIEFVGNLFLKLCKLELNWIWVFVKACHINFNQRQSIIFSKSLNSMRVNVPNNRLVELVKLENVKRLDNFSCNGFLKFQWEMCSLRFMVFNERVVNTCMLIN